MAVTPLPAATKLTVSAPRFFPPVMALRHTVPAPTSLAVGPPFIDRSDFYPLFAMFDGQVVLSSDWQRDDPIVGTPNSLKVHEDHTPVREALFSNHNAEMQLRVNGPSLVGRTLPNSGIAHKISVEAPLKLEDRKLKLDAVLAPATVTPLMDSVGAVGTSQKYAREDHIHPSDSTKFDKIGGSISGHMLPTVTGTINLGSASFRFGTVFTADLSLSNGIGDWTIVEGEDDLFIYNNKSGRVYKFMLAEVDPAMAPPKKD